jgi:hypothetical protein
MAGMSVSYSAARKCRVALCHGTCGLHNITVGGCLGFELLAAEQIKLKFCADICAATSEILAAAEHLGKRFCAPWTPPALAPASLRAILNVLGGMPLNSVAFHSPEEPRMLCGHTVRFPREQ